MALIEDPGNALNRMAEQPQGTDTSKPISDLEATKFREEVLHIRLDRARDRVADLRQGLKVAHGEVNNARRRHVSWLLPGVRMTHNSPSLQTQLRVLADTWDVLADRKRKLAKRTGEHGPTTMSVESLGYADACEDRAADLRSFVREHDDGN